MSEPPSPLASPSLPRSPHVGALSARASQPAIAEASPSTLLIRCRSPTMSLLSSTGLTYCYCCCHGALPRLFLLTSAGHGPSAPHRTCCSRRPLAGSVAAPIASHRTRRCAGSHAMSPHQIMIPQRPLSSASTATPMHACTPCHLVPRSLLRRGRHHLVTHSFPTRASLLHHHTSGFGQPCPSTGTPLLFYM